MKKQATQEVACFFWGSENVEYIHPDAFSVRRLALSGLSVDNLLSCGFH